MHRDDGTKLHWGNNWNAILFCKNAKHVCMSLSNNWLSKDLVAFYRVSMVGRILRQPPKISLVDQLVKNPPTMWKTWVQSLGWEDPLEKEMATHSSIITWRNTWTGEPGRLQTMGSQRVRHDWATNTFTIRFALEVDFSKNLLKLFCHWQSTSCFQCF